MPQLKPIQTYGINRNALESLSNDMVAVAIEQFNNLYNTSYTIETIPANLQEFVDGYILATLFGLDGMDKSKFSQKTLDRIEGIFSSNDYTGIDQTTESQFGNVQEPTETDLKNLADKRAKEISEAFAVALYHNTNDMLADDSDLNYVGAISMRDSKVRPDHNHNDGKYWKLGIQTPQYDYNCRCFYQYFKTTQEAEEAGFTPLK